MKTKMNLVILLFLLLICNSLLAYSDLRVHDPRGWHSAQGTIESATASIKPKGVYMEIGLYLTFSAKGWNYSSQDSLEILFNFTLPDNAIVHDSWLWVGEDIIRGEIMDKWTASEIYEDIVKRRQDPSILFKYNSTTYELKIYPMLASETRKVKITYLVPAQFNSNYILADLPTDLLRASRYPLSEFHILTWLDDEWKNPNIQEYPEIVFESFSDSTFGNYVRADIPTEAINNSLHFSLNSPLKNGVYLSATGDQAEGIYQLAFLPSEIINDSNSIKVALLFDYQEENCHESTIEILNTVKSYLLSNLSAADSLNLIFSNIEIKRASEHWFSADSASIEEVFEGLETNPFSNYSNLPSLLADGIEFINSNGNKGELVLISSSDQVGNYKVANELIDDLATLMESEITISVCDFQSQSWPSYYFGGRYYYGNEYFNKNITRMTSGNYYNRRSGESFLNVLSNTIGSVGGFISSFDMYTTLQNGYCYSRFNLGSQTSVVQLNKPLIQLGKYSGNFPFEIEFAGTVNSKQFSQKIVLNEDQISTVDSTAQKIWTGNYINMLESESQTNDIVSTIIEQSINYRILSIYSAFLCLDPSQGGEVCFDCMDETFVIGVEESEETENDTLIVGAYPNPFNNTVQIEVSLPDNFVDNEISFKIFNILGQEVKRFTADVNGQNHSYNFTWNGKNEEGSMVSSGTYFFIVQNSTTRKSLKLLYVK